MDRHPREDTGRVVALALAFFGGLAAIAYAEGVFARLSGEVRIALAIFAAGFAAATCILDPRVRAWLGSRVRARPRKASARSPARSPAAIGAPHTSVPGGGATRAAKAG
jgi:hypothetical protein